MYRHDAERACGFSCFTSLSSHLCQSHTDSAPTHPSLQTHSSCTDAFSSKDGEIEFSLICNLVVFKLMTDEQIPRLFDLEDPKHMLNVSTYYRHVRA